MKPGILLLLACSFVFSETYSQVSISQPASTPDASAMLDVQSASKGVLVPRMLTGERTGISNPATGLLVFQTDGSTGFYYNAGTPGAPNWVRLSSTLTGWSTTGNGGTDTAINFLGTTDNRDLKLRVNNSRFGKLSTNGNVFLGENSGNANALAALFNNGIGREALAKNTSGNFNTAIGSFSLSNNVQGVYNTSLGYITLKSNTDGDGNTALGNQVLSNNNGNFNTATGMNALFANTTGDGNTAIGVGSLDSNKTGNSNVAVGRDALKLSTSLSNIVAVGDSALYHNGVGATISIEGAENTALGSKALYTNTTGGSNTSVGSRALYSNSIGSNNTATGTGALYSNTEGSGNTAIGSGALRSNSYGGYNSATGTFALYSNTSGMNNTANGYGALYTNQFGGDDNSAMGSFAMYNNSGGNANTAMGSTALYTNFAGHHNSGVGYRVLHLNNSGSFNTAFGAYALYNNSAKNNLVAIGDSALYKNGIGASTAVHSTDNTALGSRALVNNTTGYQNVAVGPRSLHDNTSGYANIAVGGEAMNNNTIGTNNVAIGFDALYKALSATSNIAIGSATLYNNLAHGNTAIGVGSLVNNINGSRNTAVGINANSSAPDLVNATAVGADAVVGASNSIVLGSINGVNGATSNVNVGIGTTIPAARFHIKHNSFPTPSILIEESEDDYTRMEFRNTNANSFWQINASPKTVATNARLEIWNTSNGATYTPLVITGDGNVGIGTTAPATTLHVKGTVNVFNGGVNTHTGSFWAGTSNIDGMEIVSSGGGDVYIGVQRAAGAGVNVSRATGAGTLISFSVGGVQVGSIATNGSTTSFNTTSDFRLKENIEPAREGLSTIMDINVKDYNYSFDGSKQLHTGFLAQELYKVFPQAVTPGGSDARSNPWTIDYSKLTPLLVKGMQEQQAEILALQVHNKQLTDEADMLKKQLSIANEAMKKIEALNDRLQKLESGNR